MAEGKKVGLETAVLALMMIVVDGGGYMTWRVIDVSASHTQHTTSVKIPAVHMSIRQLAARMDNMRMRSRRGQETAGAPVPKPADDNKPADDKKSADDKKK